MFIRSSYNYGPRMPGLDCSVDEDMAKQEFKEECDINEVLRKFNVTGQLPSNVRMPTYGDFTGVTNFQDALAAIEQAREAFMEMPANVRRRFENDPGQFVDFFSDPANLAEARELGLVPPGEVAAAPLSTSTPVGSPVVPAASAASVAVPTAPTHVST